MVVLYHYTDEAGLNAIYKTDIVKASPGGAYGAGVYFTELPPTTPKQQIALNNWGSASYETRTRFWFKYRTEDYPAIRQVSSGSRNIWLHNGDMKLIHNSRMKLFHYTDRVGMEGIRSSGIIKKNKPKDFTKKDGTVQSLPAGVYFTELLPDHSKDRGKRMRRVFGSTARDEALYRKTKYWYWFRVGDLPGVRKQRAAHGGYEWVIESDVDIKKGRR